MSSFLSRLTAEPAPLPWIQQQRWHAWAIVGIVSMGAFIGQFDATVVQLALPSLRHQFDISIHHVSWVALSYLLAFVAFLPIFGRLCEMYGRKRLYIVGYLIFIVASALCGMVSEFWQLLAFRFLQGVGGALLGANSMSILVHNVPLAQRARALGWFSAAQAVGMSAGPALGGILLQTLGWQWIFWLTVPVGGLAVIAGWMALPQTSAAPANRRFDWGGALLLSPALALIVYVLSRAAAHHVNVPLTIAMAVAAGGLLLLWVRHERRSSAPLIDPGLFGSAAFCAAAAGTMLAYAQISAMFFLMAFAETKGLGETAMMSGLKLAILPLAIGLAAPCSSAVRERVGRHRIGWMAMALCLCAGALLFTTLDRPDNHTLFDSLAFAIFGVGLGLFIAPNNDVALAVAPSAQAGSAGALINLVRVLGTILGVAGGTAMLSLNLHELSDVPHIRYVSGPVMLAAVRDSLPLLAAMSLLAAALARFSSGRMAAPDARTTG